MHQQNLCHEWCTQVLELGIGLGHIRRYINKMLFVGCLRMYWNWVLDWVISDDASTKSLSWVMYSSIGIGYWIRSYRTIHQQNVIRGLSMSIHALELGVGLGHIGLYINKILFVGCLPMYWNWVLDWVISNVTLTKCCSWVVYPCIGIEYWIWE